MNIFQHMIWTTELIILLTDIFAWWNKPLMLFYINDLIYTLNAILY